MHESKKRTGRRSLAKRSGAMRPCRKWSTVASERSIRMRCRAKRTHSTCTPAASADNAKDKAEEKEEERVKEEEDTPKPM